MNWALGTLAQPPQATCMKRRGSRGSKDLWDPERRDLPDIAFNIPLHRLRDSRKMTVSRCSEDPFCTLSETVQYLYTTLPKAGLLAHLVTGIS